MTFDPLIPLWIIGLLCVPLALLSAVLAVLRPRYRWAWVRRLAIVLLLAVVALRPVTPIPGELTERLNVSIFFVVDRTGSMNAEDGPDGRTRLDLATDDMQRIMEDNAGARFGIIAFDSVATEQLPLSTDVGAVSAWIDTVETERTSLSQGSNIDRALPALTAAVLETSEDAPEDSIVLYLLSDGENTDGEASENFSGVASRLDGGAVLGYGTTAGGPMKANGGENDGEYISAPGGGQGISHADPENLTRIATQLGVDYKDRTNDTSALSGTMQGISPEMVPVESFGSTARVQDWFWIPAIGIALLFIWELGAMTFHLPRRSTALGR